MPILVIYDLPREYEVEYVYKVQVVQGISEEQLQKELKFIFKTRK